MVNQVLLKRNNTINKKSTVKNILMQVISSILVSLIKLNTLNHKLLQLKNSIKYLH